MMLVRPWVPGLMMLGVVAGIAATPALARPQPAAIAALDTDHDGTLDWNEVQAAAIAKFNAANPDKDGTLDAKEAKTLGISARQLRGADPDKDGTLDQNEFLALVKQRFEAADADHDGTVSQAELATRHGHALLRLIQ